MPKKKHKPEEIINKLREAELAIHKGKTVPEVCRALGVTEQTYYRWRKEYAGMSVQQAKKLKELEKENARLKAIVADQAVDISILKEAARGNF